MLDTKARLDLQRRWFPNADECTQGPLRSALREFVRPGSVVLDAGCSTGTWVLRPFRSSLGCVIGTDVCVPPEVLFKPFVLADIHKAPLADDSLGMIVCYNVIEHLARPQQALKEFARMLKPGGILVCKTPSLQAPVIMLSRLTSQRAHRRLKKAWAGAEGRDVFPTLYRCNTVRELDRSLRAAGLRRERLWMVDQTYEYLAFSGCTYTLGLLYSRAVQSGPLNRLGTGICAIYTKPTPGVEEAT